MKVKKLGILVFGIVILSGFSPGSEKFKEIIFGARPFEIMEK